uniref:Uncharacterized protein n=1 Tax=Calcidiscus leptoporus TaxID=127549 RepID=A0A6U5EDM8_9EUKA|mmetsp:Transcript_19842/g.45737  ORF Transcript_19842/g.45737 Transcript_19842/m.45737 type:complete len:287 (+) Transcript_19842:23-883(+)|eukprot:CAMPEP_0119355198 /NCGR_PEP_ID=MMETSP1334-20130426/4060_1 /TAXON_ID=127549 /ORGANISM="Calcidiscus leptoporus, Strain RCC1130" /LENGTH=286 /DNA_ID=CAMNT_0007368949 /DNA_START=21 /DNA_END=881 /DNA_ORIENTATION=-
MQRSSQLPGMAPMLLVGALSIAGALNLGAPHAHVRAVPRFSTRAMQPLMQAAEEAMEEVLEEAMDEEEWLAEQAAEEQKELSSGAKKVINNMRSETGVEFAPWMKIDPEAIARAEKERKERKARQAALATSVDVMDLDPQAAELGGGGLRSKILSEEEVELRWSTGNEAGNEGFLVQRRAGGSNNFEVIASYEKVGALKSKGPQGGVYAYLDDTVPSTGTWVYRVLDCDSKGMKQAICQKLVEVDSQSEQTATLVIGGVLFGIALVLFGVALFEDPIQTTSAGRGF